MILYCSKGLLAKLSGSNYLTAQALKTQRKNKKIQRLFVPFVNILFFGFRGAPYSIPGASRARASG
ncbi:MAG: hypothetical protein BECKG1743D_GA0114223_101563 [Candidatus Kentron sp. G]|nr:MAG: hypothetical protein BECKG1743F_GA0114225_101383 [Candidatus Kentron sp. G]VFM98030.1 MAG: hypothetical protein BECKG1743E_GA0114224_101632 [Candidatus Kentron sp. G]VFM99902.1 MAG: hypothetical protein BECKG1743D_GA0114223_101563 [Candidatus Kentron sp. G]